MKRFQFSYAIWPWGIKTREVAEAAVKDIRDVGYTSLEATKGMILAYELDCKACKAMLDRYGVRAESFFFGLPAFGKEATLFDTLERELDFAANVGATLVTLQGTFGRPEEMNEAAKAQNLENMHRFARLAKSFGLKTNAHPHVNTYFMFADEIDYVMENSDSDLIGLAPDTAHIAAAGADPVAIVRKYAKRVRYTHLKDYKLCDAAPGASWVGSGAPIMSCFCALGDGVLDIPEILRILAAVDYRGPLGVEMDSAPVSNVASAKQNYEYLAGYVKD